MKYIQSLTCIILMYFRISSATWTDEENCIYTNCEGEGCPRKDDLCPYIKQINMMDSHIKPLSKMEEIDLSPDKNCEIDNYSRRYVTSMQCIYNKSYISCDSPLPISTVVTYECARLYEPINGRTLCNITGEWSEPISCIPECGKTYPEEVEPLILHGSQVESGQWPWAAALFQRKKDSTWKLECGGTLVATNLVITAAHCVWKKAVKDIFIVLGYLPRKLPTENRKDVIYQVKRIYLLPVYRDRTNGWSSDISILTLKSPAKISQNILPACLPQPESIKVSPYTMAIVSGWGKNEGKVLSSRLYYAKMPIIDLRKCLRHLPQSFQKFLSYTTFCAGYINGTGVCNGDSGGGLLTQHKGRWELQGIVSVSARGETHLCHPRNYALFTKVQVFIAWILEVITFEKKKLQESEVEHLKISSFNITNKY